MIEIRLAGVMAQVAAAPTGEKILVLTDPGSGIAVIAPFEAEAAHEIAAGLTGIAIANGMPKNAAALPFERPG